MRNINLTMNIKERGITVGDLIIAIILIITATLLVQNLNKDKKSKINLLNQENINHKETILLKNNPYIKCV